MLSPVNHVLKPNSRGRVATSRRPEADGPAPRGATVSLEIESARDTTTPQPVSVGLPFPRAAVLDAGTLRLSDAEARTVLSQARPLAHWPGGSVKWLLLDFVAGPLRKGTTRWLLREDAVRSAAPSDGLNVVGSPSEFAVDAGPVSFRLGNTGPHRLLRATVGANEVFDGGALRVVLKKVRGKPQVLRVRSVELEEQGPVRATFRAEGTLAGRTRVVVRLCFFAGTGLVRVRLTLHNPRRARHRGGLWDLGDRGSLLFRDLSVEFPVLGAGDPTLTWAAGPGQPPRSGRSGFVEVYQASSGGENWQSRNHVNRDGRVTGSQRGYRVRHRDGEETGLRARPVVSVRGENADVALAVPEFWQQFPKAVEADGRVLRIRLFPEQFGDLFELQGGEQKTHTFWLHVGAAGASSELPLEWADEPARVHASPAWYAASGAVPYLSVSPHARLDALLAEARDGENDPVRKREVIDEYGWRHYGDFYADHEGAYYKGAAPVVSHYNNQYDAVFGAVQQYLRTGDPYWFGLFDPLARHVIDIDLYHTDEDKAAYNGGLFWHTDHYKDAATATHRAYSRANRGSLGRAYGGGPSNEHNYTTGLLHYHYLTGDPLAREAVLGLADWVVRMDDGGRNVLGLVDDGPTGLASSTAAPDYHGPGRGAGNSVNALIDGWLLSGRRGYLDKAEELIRRCVHPDDDVAARALLNVELRWSYTVFLSVLARYLGAKAEAGELDFMYAYGRAGLLRYAAWMAEHERPYFDHPEKLECPTETWAAHDLRKGNVLRLAAAHADEPLRSRFLARADELAGRGWDDLFRFSTRTAARPLAVLMTEGTRDGFFREHGVAAAPRPAADHDFGRPERFVSQRARVRARMKSAAGLAGLLLRAADPRNWRRVLARRGEGR